MSDQQGRRTMGKLMGSPVNHVYMIRSKKTGLFAQDGGYRVSWGKRGRSFNQINHVRAHINTKKNDYANTDAEIVEMELLEIAVHPIENPNRK